MNASGGVVIGLVKNLRDPEGEGRILVDYPMLPGSQSSAWAPIAQPFAGKNRGMFFMPEIGDEAVLSFQHGDTRHPVVVGFLWNGNDKPPSGGIDEKVRRIRSLAGHEIDLDDRPGREGVTITTAGGCRIEMTDKPGGVHVAIMTPGGQKVDIVDLPVPSISISAPLGKVSIDCLQATVTAAAGLTVNAPITTFAGVIQATAVIAGSIASPIYTPGLGNFI
jgi:phage baseplate assembly protein gpV